MTQASRIAVAVLAAILLAVIASAARDANHSTLTFRGDFPAFLRCCTDCCIRSTENRCTIVRYNAMWKISFGPSLSGEYYFFAYPPYVAVLLSPLSFLPAHIAKNRLYSFNVVFCFGRQRHIFAK